MAKKDTAKGKGYIFKRGKIFYFLDKYSSTRFIWSSSQSILK